MSMQLQSFQTEADLDAGGLERLTTQSASDVGLR